MVCARISHFHLREIGKPVHDPTPSPLISVQGCLISNYVAVPLIKRIVSRCQRAGRVLQMDIRRKGWWSASKFPATRVQNLLIVELDGISAQRVAAIDNENALADTNSINIQTGSAMVVVHQLLLTTDTILGIVGTNPPWDLAMQAGDLSGYQLWIKFGQMVDGVGETLPSLWRSDTRPAINWWRNGAKLSGFLQRFDLGSFFEQFRLCDDVFVPKPDAYRWMTAAQRFGQWLQQLVIVENSEFGIQPVHHPGASPLAINAIMAQRHRSRMPVHTSRRSSRCHGASLVSQQHNRHG